MQATGGVNDEDIEDALLRRLQGSVGYPHRIVARIAGVERGAHLLG
ncbi:MAG: hypothetical protein RLZ79_1733 [Pseudomonadota bacterium]